MAMLCRIVLILGTKRCVFGFTVMRQYATLGDAIYDVCQAWCKSHGYSDPFCRNGEWWAFPPSGVIPIQIKSVLDDGSEQVVKIGSLELTLFPDGTVSSAPSKRYSRIRNALMPYE